jgi:hypothetical protein
MFQECWRTVILSAHFQFTTMKIPKLYLTLISGSLLTVALWLGLYFYIRHGLFQIPRQHHRIEVLANVGNAFGAVGVLVSAGALGAIFVTVLVQTQQVEAANRQVEAANEQVKVTLNGIEKAARYQHFLALEPRVGEVISNDEIAEFNRHVPSDDSAFGPWFRVEAEIQDYTQETDSQFLTRFSEALLSEYPQIPRSDKFRRRHLFFALDRVYSGALQSEKVILGELLKSQIHDKAARMLIIKALAEKDEDTLRIFAKVGIAFDVLNEAPALVSELKKRFADGS